MGRCVLIVDDEFLVLMTAREVLESAGCEVMEAHDGPAALAALKGNPDIDLLISDINMPSMEGYELAEIAMRLRPGIGVLLMSGEQTSRYGLSVIRKPFRRDELITALGQVGGCEETPPKGTG